jgi:hypothetical protein
MFKMCYLKIFGSKLIKDDDRYLVLRLELSVFFVVKLYIL